MSSTTAADVRQVFRGNGVVATLLVAGLAGWLTLWLWAQSDERRYLHHDTLSATENPAGPLLLMVGWLVMIVAMMLPLASRFVSVVHQLVADRPHSAMLTMTSVAGFLLPWALAGQAFQALDIGVHGLVANAAWLDTRVGLVNAALLVGAGVYQFTDLKQRCLMACRSPISFAMRMWTGARPAAESFRIGTAYGMSCVGCCWTLMLVMFAAGLASLWWMVLLTALMTAERLAPWGRQVGNVAGVVFIVAGLWMGVTAG